MAVVPIAIPPDERVLVFPYSQTRVAMKTMELKVFTHNNLEHIVYGCLPAKRYHNNVLNYTGTIADACHMDVVNIIL